MRVEEGFQQPIPELSNGYSDDVFLPSLLKRLLPHEYVSKSLAEGIELRNISIQEVICQDLQRLGNDINGPIRALGALADTPPTLTQYSHWGRRIDLLQTSEGWRRLKALTTKEGIVSLSYSREYGEYSRLYAMVKTLLFTAEGRVVGCPISMTDGCARVLELLGTEEMKGVFRRLTSDDPTWAFTSGQFMTERSGGSDISLTETVATPSNSNGNPGSPGSVYRLNGFKWFSSATDSEVALALARTGSPSLGSRSLSLFLLPLRLPLPDQNTPTPTGVLPRTSELVQGEPINNGILIHRLKNKIGTHSVPTAELSLNNSLAYLVGPLNGGVKAITTVLQITRVHSSFHSVGSLARCLAIATEFAKVRRIDGGRRGLDEVPLHVGTLAKVSVTYRALLSFALNTAHLLGQLETAPSSSNYPSIAARFRLLNPVLKAFATHHCIPAMEECMSALGGQGYMEETGIGRLIRDAVVERIWEGTENVLAVDLIRANRSQDGKEPVGWWVDWAGSIIHASHEDGIEDKEFKRAVQVLREMVDSTPTRFKEIAKNDLLTHLNLLLFGHVTSALYLLEHSLWAIKSGEPDHDVHIEAFVRWVMEGGVTGSSLISLRGEFERVREDGGRVERDRKIVLGQGKDKGMARL